MAMVLANKLSSSAADLDAIYEATEADHGRALAAQLRAYNRRARGPPATWADIHDLKDRYRKSGSTLDRWFRDPELNFPKPRLVRGKRLWAVSDLEAFDDRLREQS
jgi:hypothetical protein